MTPADQCFRTGQPTVRKPDLRLVEQFELVSLERQIKLSLQLEARLKLSRSTIYDKINPTSPRYDATFPTPIRLGNGSAVGWIEDEVESWLRGRIEASRKPG